MRNVYRLVAVAAVAAAVSGARADEVPPAPDVAPPAPAATAPAADAAPAAEPAPEPVSAPATGPSPRVVPQAFAPTPPRVRPTPPARPAAEPRKGGFVLQLGWDLGAEDQLWVQFDDGSKSTIKANSGFWMSIGGSFLRRPLGPKARLDTFTTVGLKGDSITASNGSASFFGFTLEVVERLWADPLRLGVGLSYLVAPHYSGDGMLASFEGSLDNSLGVVLQAEFVGYRDASGRGGSVGARYLWQKLARSMDGIPFSANTFGLFLGCDL